jgi:hypothetical protein
LGVLGAPPLHAVMLALADQCLATMDSCKMTASLFEAKGGVRGCLIDAKPLRQPAGPLSASAPGKKAFKEVTAHLKDNTWGVLEIVEPPKKKKVASLIRTAYDASVFTTIPVPSDADWAMSLFDPQFFGFRSDFVYVGLTPFAMMEARCLISGKQVIGGIAVDHVSGVSLKDKRTSIFKMTFDELKPLFLNHGFLGVVTNEKLCVLPTGFLYIVVGLETGWGVRWGLAADEQDTARAQTLLRDLLTSFPDLTDPAHGHAQFLEYLSAQS